MIARTKATGRDKEARVLRRSNQAAAAARLMLKDIRTWEEFLEPSMIDYANLPRRQLKSGTYDIKKEVKKRNKNIL